MNTEERKLYEQHLTDLTAHWEAALARHDFDGAWITAGDEEFYLFDDHGPTFKPNPHLAQWVAPHHLPAQTLMWISSGHKPKLLLQQSDDYWHAQPEPPADIDGAIDIEVFPDTTQLRARAAQIAQGVSRVAIIGAAEQGDNELSGAHNPSGLLDDLNFHRATKSAFELATMRRASEIGAAGHVAAAQAFHAGATEFEIHIAYLTASSQTEAELPYGNIIALNEHASILHYHNHDRVHPSPPRSFLIDAGGNYRGYASDISRTHATQGAAHQTFADLIERMDAHQQNLVAQVKPGIRFAELHAQMHTDLTQVLIDSGIIQSNLDLAMSERVSETFCPHGLGHLLGIQVHDVGGHLADAMGNPAPPAENYPTLRFTRAVEENYVFTVEPGLYFIPSLLSKLRSASLETLIDWQLVDALTPYGGIRIEDNVAVTAEGCENLTRDAFSRIGS